MVVRFLSLLLALALFSSGPDVRAAERFITVASTTSTENSGLFAHILPLFTAASGIAVRVVAVGTTSVRVLESLGQPDGTVVAGSGDTQLFLYPGVPFLACNV